MGDVVALLLDDAMPAARLGSLLRDARKRRGLTRKQAAEAAGISAGKLRRYEHGDKAVPADACARLAECYGDDLSAHVPRRIPPQIGDRRIVVGGVEQAVGPDVEDILAGFVEIVQRLRDAEPGAPLALRATDMVALAGALGRDRDEIEGRIAEALGCSRTVARKLHTELLRRKVILPVAGLAAGVAAFAGAAYTSHSPSPGARVETSTPGPAKITSAVSPTTAKRVAPTTAKIAPQTTAPTTAPAPPPPPAVSPSQVPPTNNQPRTDATVPPAQQPADTPVSLAPPQPDPNDPPVSIPPGETPVTIIGTATQVSETTTTAP